MVLRLIQYLGFVDGIDLVDAKKVIAPSDDFTSYSQLDHAKNTLNF